MKLLKIVWGAFSFVLAVASFLNPDLFGTAGLVLAAIPAFGGASSYDLGTPSGGANLDLAQEISAILLADTMFLGRISQSTSKPVTNVDHYWVEESLNAHYVQLNGAHNDSTTTITVDSTAGVQIGALLQNETELGVDEIMQVTAVDSATAFTVVRNVGDTGNGASAHLDNSRLRVIGQPKQEGDENVNDQSKVRSRKHNVCQIFKKEVKISGTQQAIDMAGVPNEFQHQLAMRMLELKRELAMSVWSSVKITAGGTGGSDSVIRSMAGVRSFIPAAQRITAQQAFSEGLINALYKKIYDQGGEAKIALGQADIMRSFSQLNADKVRYSASEKARGTFVTTYLNEYGQELDLVIDRWAQLGDLAVLDPARVKLGWLQGRNLSAKPLKEEGDALRGFMVGECTLEVHNAAECFALATKVTAAA